MKYLVLFFQIVDQNVADESLQEEGIKEEGLDLDIVNQMNEMSLREKKEIEEEADEEVKEQILTANNPVFESRASSSKVKSQQIF